MSSQHLSDEAVAAFADTVLTGAARERATRHVNRCPECAYAVAVQREAIGALRAAAAPSLPGGLLDRLRHVPTTTLLHIVPTTIGPDGSTMFPAFGTSGPAGPAAPAPFGAMAARFAAAALPFAAAALAPLAESERADPAQSTARPRRGMGHGPMAFTVAALAAAGVLAAGSVSHDARGSAAPTREQVSTVFVPADFGPATFASRTGSSVASRTGSSFAAQRAQARSR
jgi:hypothetical protein